MTKLERNINLDFYNKIAEILKNARSKVVQTVNKTMVYTYFEIGRTIVEEEQKGRERAEYGKQIIKELSQRLTREFGKGFSTTNLKQMRQFYLTYSKSQTLSDQFENMRRLYLSYSISETPSRKLIIEKSETLSRNFNTPDFQLSWSHYLFLIKIDNINEREFYEMKQ